MALYFGFGCFAHQLTLVILLLQAVHLIINNDSVTVSGITLAGVTIKSLPFVNTDNNKFSGFCIDLMNLISEHTKLNYSLYLVQDGAYGPGDGTNVGSVAGLIGDVYRKKADFAIADMTVTRRRAEYVTFSEPFLRFSISALVRRRFAQRLANMDDLAVKSNLSIGTFANGKTLHNMQMHAKDIRNIRWLHSRILRDESNLVRTIDQALHKVMTEPFAFIQEEPINLYYSSLNCSLKTLTDQNYYLVGEYAIAFHHDSPYIQLFNRAIKKITYSGQMRKLIKKYFYNDQCNNGAGASPHRTSLNTSFNYLLIIFVNISITYIWNHFKL